MKKILTYFVFLMMLLVSSPFITTNLPGYPSRAIVGDTPPYVILNYTEIRNLSGVDVWNSVAGAPFRPDPYISNGEELYINVTIHDENGIFINPGDPHNDPSHVVKAFISNYTDTVFWAYLEFRGYRDIAHKDAYFDNTTTMMGPGIFQCTHYINVTINDQSFTPTDVILNPIYLNPETNYYFEPPAIIWSSLALGSPSTSIDVGADDNSYEFNFSAVCHDYSGEVHLDNYVRMRYNLSISGTDMINGSLQTSIPVGNINYSVSETTDQLSFDYKIIDTFTANLPVLFDFNLTLPPVIQPGEYSGNINLLIETK